MNLTAMMDVFSEGKKVRRVDWPEGAYLQRQGAFISTPAREENFSAWIEDDAARKFVVYSDGKGELSRPSDEEVKKLLSLQDPEEAVRAVWEIAD